MQPTQLPVPQKHARALRNSAARGLQQLQEEDGGPWQGCGARTDRVSDVEGVINATTVVVVVERDVVEGMVVLVVVVDVVGGVVVEGQRGDAVVVGSILDGVGAEVDGGVAVGFDGSWESAGGDWVSTEESEGRAFDVRGLNSEPEVLWLADLWSSEPSPGRDVKRKKITAVIPKTTNTRARGPGPDT